MSTESHRVDGKAAIITGGSRGIGFGIASELVARGARVCITARKEEELARAVAELDPDGVGRAIAVRGKADDADHQREAVEATMSAFGRLDLMVNNVATHPYFGPAIDAPIGAVRKTFEVNVFAALAWTQLAWRAWQGEHGGAVLNVASIGGLSVARDVTVYNASKAALVHLTRQLSLELAPKVRVNAIAPALIKTEFARVLWEPDEQGVAEAYPLDRIGTPTDTAKLSAFLLSDDASWITGQTVVIDGGLTQVSAS